MLLTYENKLLGSIKSVFDYLTSGQKEDTIFDDGTEPGERFVDELIMGHMNFDEIFIKGRQFDYIHESKRTNKKKIYRLELAWVSPEKNLYLFHKNSTRFGALSRLELAHRVHNGKIIPLGITKEMIHNHVKEIH